MLHQIRVPTPQTSLRGHRTIVSSTRRRAEWDLECKTTVLARHRNEAAVLISNMIHQKHGCRVCVGPGFLVVPKLSPMMVDSRVSVQNNVEEVLRHRRDLQSPSNTSITTIRLAVYQRCGAMWFSNTSGIIRCGDKYAPMRLSQAGHRPQSFQTFALPKAYQNVRVFPWHRSR